MMKKIFLTSVVLLLALMLAACGLHEFGMSENTAKRMTITAKRASKDEFFMVGSLEVDEGEKVVITSGLEKGEIRVDVIGTPAGQNIDEIPEFDVEPVLTANLSKGEEISGTLLSGSYLVKAICLEKATGTVVIEVRPAD
jgi:hypothetical protein